MEKVLWDKGSNYSLSNILLPLAYNRESPHGIMAKVVDCSLKVSEFKLQLCY